MQKIKKLLQEINQLLKKSDYLTNTTYPVIKEPKLLCSITECLQKTTEKIIELVIYRERLYKRINVIKRPYIQEFETFKKIAKKYDISEEEIEFIKELKRIVAAKKESPMEFKRRNKYVICSNNYNMNVLDFKKVKNYVQKTKKIVQNLNKKLI